MFIRPLFILLLSIFTAPSSFGADKLLAPSRSLKACGVLFENIVRTAHQHPELKDGSTPQD